MANNNIEQYLEAMLAALDGDTVPDVPSPSWNIEKYLAAILTKLSSGGGSGGGDVVVSHITADVSGDELVYSCDMTESEIEEALDAGKTVLAVFANAVSIWTMLSSPVADFITIFTRGNTILYNSFVFSDGSLQMVSNSYTLTPAT